MGYHFPQHLVSLNDHRIDSQALMFPITDPSLLNLQDWFYVGNTSGPSDALSSSPEGRVKVMAGRLIPVALSAVSWAFQTSVFSR